MSLYAWLNLLSISVPFLVSFHPKIRLYKNWKSLFLAIFLTMIPYIIWDIYFTDKGYWGFNDAYLHGHAFMGLPIEEWLFFICIPYACAFTHRSLLALNSKISLSNKVTNFITYGLLLLFAALLIFNFERAYTMIDMVFAIVVLLVTYRYNRSLLRSFYLTFLVMLIPFLIVNGILTGSGIEDQVVWYNDMENLGIRFLTIPVEDFGYAFSLILMNLLLFERFSKSNMSNPALA